MHGLQKRIVYILRSQSDTHRHYVGVTDNNIAARLEWHNRGRCGHTVLHRPWVVVATFEFQREATALRFEKYLKSASGRAFAKRHFARASDKDPRGRLVD